jgi:hypothetical protein
MLKMLIINQNIMNEAVRGGTHLKDRKTPDYKFYVKFCEDNESN